MVNSEKLIVTTTYVTLYTRRRLNRCRYNRVRLYLPVDKAHIFSNGPSETSQKLNLQQHGCIKLKSRNYKCGRSSQTEDRFIAGYLPTQVNSKHRLKADIHLCMKVECNSQFQRSSTSRQHWPQDAWPL
jgi:hypothetical protein